MSRSSRKPKGRPYQPLPERHNPWVARMVILVVAALLIFGSLALFATPR